MEINTFSKKNLYRCESIIGFKHKLNAWSLSDWMTAVVGEVGEGANIIKKMNRLRDAIPDKSLYDMLNEELTMKELRRMLADELADAYIYLDLLIQAAGFETEKIVENKFKKTSIKIGFEK